MNDYLTIAQTAEKLGMSRQGVHYHLKRGKFGKPCVNAGVGEAATTGRPPQVWIAKEGYTQFLEARLAQLERLQSLYNN